MTPTRTRVWLVVFVVIVVVVVVVVWSNNDDDTDKRHRQLALTAYLTLGARQRAAQQGGAAIYSDPPAELLASAAVGVWPRLCLLLGRHFASDDSLIRHRIVDQLLRSGGGCTAAAPARWLVLSIGAGFDTRPCRLSAVLGAGCAAPALWIEVDHAAVVLLKQRLLANCAALRLALPPGDAQLSAIAQQLPAYRPLLDRVDVLLEGVWTYLLPAEKRALLDALRRLYPRHRLVVDLLPDDAVPWPSAALSRALGAPWQPAGQLPQLFFLARGYRLAAKLSRDDHGRELPHSGYAVYVFDLDDG